MDNIIRLLKRKPNNLNEALIRGTVILAAVAMICLIGVIVTVIMLFPLVIGHPWIYALYALPVVLLLGYLG